MQVLHFDRKAYTRPRYGLSQSRLQNLTVEKTDDGYALIPRPGLKASTTLGGGPIRAVYQQNGVFSGDRFTVSAAEVYRGSALIGTILNPGPVTIAASNTQLVITSGGLAYVYNGSTLAQITDPDLPTVSGVVFFAGRFIYTEAASDRFYWSAVNDATSIDGLDFATAEGWPDPNLGVLVYGDELVFPGSATFEFWSATGDADAPFEKTQLRRYMQGGVAFASVVLLDNSFYFVGEGEQGLAVFRGGRAVPEAVSDNGVAQALSECTDTSLITAFTAGWGGHLFYVVNIPGQTSFAYDVTTKLWAEWTSYAKTLFRACCAVMVGGTAYLGDSASGQIWTLDTRTFLDGTDPITRLATAHVPMPAGRKPHHRLMLDCARGVGTSSGQGYNPLVELRYSDDGGNIWSDWKPRTLGKIGRYRDRAIWEGLGEVIQPGRDIEVRCTDSVVTTFNTLVSAFQGDARF